MIKHLHNKKAIKMTTSQKYVYKTEGYCKAWDPTMSITAYFTDLDRFQISFDDRGIAQMWESEMFTKDQMVAWENKPTADQTWDNLQTYFLEKWLKRCQYLAATTKQLLRFKKAALAAQEQASAEEEQGEAQAMMFALLQNQHELQLGAMSTTNRATMDVMMEQMNAILGSGSGRTSNQNKENTPPTTNATRGGNNEAKKVKRKKKLCPHCNMFVFRKPDRCYELDTNKNKRWVG
jgi:hypothetical protein